MDEITVSKVPASMARCRVYAGKTRAEAIERAEAAFKGRGWTLPAECYVLERRWCWEVWLPCPMETQA